MEFNREVYQKILGQLKSERTSFISTWREIGEFLVPRRPRFFITDANKGDRRNQKILDSTPLKAVRTLRAGMMSGVTSPARPWFKLELFDPILTEILPVKTWLEHAERTLLMAFVRSNLYSILPIAYGDISTFGTAAILIEEDEETVFRFYSIPIGSYCIGLDHKGKVNIFTREFRMTVAQIVERFGKIENGRVTDWSNISVQVRHMFEAGTTEAWVDVTHIIKPNLYYSKGAVGSKYKKYASCYYEAGTYSQQGGIAPTTVLSESGYDYFPVLAPRWEVTGEDVYGTNSPGIEAIGDVKGLQVLQRKKLKGIDKMVDPPVIMPTSMSQYKNGLLPGEVVFSDQENSRGVRPAYEVNPRIQEVLMDIEDHRQRIRSMFFEDLFLMVASIDRTNVTAREIDAKYEEKFQMLGPVLNQLDNDMLDPLIEICFALLAEQELLPPPPPEIAGMPIKIEYVSVMAQAQKLIGLNNVERFFQFSMNIAQANPDALRSLHFGRAIKNYGLRLSVPTEIFKTDDEMLAEAQAQAEMMEQQQQMAQAEQASQIAANIGKVDIGGGKTPYDEMLEQSGGLGP